MAMSVEPNMDYMRIDDQKMIEILKRIKKGKATGPDTLKGEFYSALIVSEKCIKTLVKCMKNELNSATKPEEWRKSRTNLIEKRSKPTIKDYRPIALTNVSYKLFMSLIKNAIEEHLDNSNQLLEEQAGFTKNAGIEDSIAILKHKTIPVVSFLF